MNRFIAASFRFAPRRVLLVALFGAVIVVGTVFSNTTAILGRQSLTDIPEGIRIEALATGEELPFGPQKTWAVLLRYTYAPGAHLDLPYPGPVLVYVESGTLNLDGVGNHVSIRYPPNVIEQPLTGEQITKTQKGKSPPAGTRAVVDAGGTVYAETGELGPTHNESDGELVLLVVQFVSESRPDDVTKVVIEGPDEP